MFNFKSLTLMIFGKDYDFNAKIQYFNVSETSKKRNMIITVPVFNVNKAVSIPSAGPPG